MGILGVFSSAVGVKYSFHIVLLVAKRKSLLSLLLLLGMQNVPAALAAIAAAAPGTSAVPRRGLVSVGPGLDAVWLRGGQQVHEDIVERKGGNRTNEGT